MDCYGFYVCLNPLFDFNSDVYRVFFFFNVFIWFYLILYHRVHIPLFEIKRPYGTFILFKGFLNKGAVCHNSRCSGQDLFFDIFWIKRTISFKIDWIYDVLRPLINNQTDVTNRLICFLSSFRFQLYPAFCVSFFKVAFLYFSYTFS